MKKISLLSAILLTAFLHLGAPAQQVEQIDVKSLRIFHSGNEFEASVTYVNAAQNTVTFNGWTNFGLSFINGTAKIPLVLNTDGFDNFGIVSSAPGGGGDFRFRFYVSASDSAPIALRPWILRKRNPLVLTGAAAVRARVELVDQRTLPSKVIAADTDIVLTGGYRAEFTQCAACAVRTARYQSIDFNFIQQAQ